LKNPLVRGSKVRSEAPRLRRISSKHFRPAVRSRPRIQGSGLDLGTSFVLAQPDASLLEIVPVAVTGFWLMASVVLLLSQDARGRGLLSRSPPKREEEGDDCVLPAR